ncbi:MAG: type 4a pilus biogenesis protein PilO [Desulfuromonadaceae bacterium]|nr:type 4a pilus biogenesis protein PilO [Desulfuromonadaceae bacterium]
MNPQIEKLLKLPLYQRVLILVSVSVLLVGAYIYFLYYPAREELASKQTQNKKLLVELQESRRIANNLPKFKAEYEDMKRRLDLALNELPNQKEIPSLLSSIAGLARDNGLEVLQFKPENEVVKNFYAEVPVSLDLKGSYHQMALFCQAVSRIARIVNVKDIKLSKPQQDSGTTLLSVSCRTVTYRFIETPSTEKGK